MIISNYAIKFRTAVFVFILVLFGIGIVSYRNLPREGTPDITIPFVFVTAYYEGTAPSDIETLVTIPLERQLSDVEGVKELRSTSAENICAMTIEFRAGADIDTARQLVKNRVDLAAPDLPDDLDTPVVDAFNFSSDFPVFTFALSGDTDLERLRKLGEEIQEEIELLPGVKSAELAGMREREIRVEIDLPRLVTYGIPLGMVLQRIAGENTTVSAGNIEMAGNKFQVRIPAEFVRASEIRDLILTAPNGVPVYIGDLATVIDDFKDVSSISRINGDPSLSISIKKRSGENTVALVHEVRKILDQFTLPPDVKLTVVMDTSDYIFMMLRELENNILTGFIFVVAVLFMFMGWRNSLLVAMAIPLSMLLTFALMSFMGSKLNMIVLFSLVIAVGMLVDNAVVVVENIYRNRGLGLSRREASRRGASEVAWPVITSTLTTCAAFSPLLFWPGIMGQFMGFLPRTLIIVLSASLFVALVVNPAVCSILVNTRPLDLLSGEKVKTHWFVEGYERLLRATLRRPVPVVLLGILGLVLSAQIYARYGRGQELFPSVEPRNATISVKFPQGTGIEKTDKAVQDIEEQLARYKDIQFYLSTVGSGGAFGPWGGGAGTHQANIHVEFLSAEERGTNTIELVGQIRHDIGQIAGAEIVVQPEAQGPPTGNPVSIELSGDDFDELAHYSKEISRAIENIPGLVDLRDDMEEALPELQFRIDRQRASWLGVDARAVGMFLRTAIYGTVSSKFRVDEDEHDITVILARDQRSNLTLLEQVRIPDAAGGSVPLSSLGEVVYTGGRGAINRKDRKRVVTISGNNEVVGVDEILKTVRERISKLELPRGYTVTYAGDTKEMKEASVFLSRAFGVASALILVILVIQFNSALLPLIIMFSVALSLMGVMWGLLICRLKFGVIMTGVGCISLAGVVVNNAIVLVDCVIQRRKEGQDAIESLVSAGRLRLRPVLLTACTTILGLLPMAVGYSLEIHEWPPRIIAGAETSSWWAPMAVAVIFGLGVATLLTLILVPAMYRLADSLAGWLKRVSGWDPDV